MQHALSKLDKHDSIVNLIFVNHCDYLVYPIDYLDESGATVVRVDLDGYARLNKTFSLPTRVRILNYLNGEVTDSLKLSLKRDGIRQKQFSERQRAKMFTRPEPKGYDQVIPVTNADHFQENQ